MHTFKVSKSNKRCYYRYVTDVDNLCSNLMYEHEHGNTSTLVVSTMYRTCPMNTI